MKRLLSIEVDSGNRTCGGCEYLYHAGDESMACSLFDSIPIFDEGHGDLRADECLQAEKDNRNGKQITER